MSWQNYQEVIDQLTSHGLIVDHLDVGTPKPKRCKVVGERERRGWYWLTDIKIDNDWFIVGSYGIWHGNDQGTVKVALSKEAKKLTAEQKAAISERHKQNAKTAQAILDSEHKTAADLASNAWTYYQTTGISPYLQTKGVGAHGVRFDHKGKGTVIVPMQDITGKIWGIQVIRSNVKKEREKQYWPTGLKKQGNFHVIGSIMQGSVVLLAEGYATAASLFEATGLPVVVAFDAGNLLPVAKELMKAYRHLKILVCADDDFVQKCQHCKKPTIVENPNCTHCGKPHGKSNAGVIAAQNTALSVSGAWVMPQFPADRGVEKLTDFNDLQHFPNGGAHLIRVQIEKAIEKAGWSAPKQSLAAVETQQGSGDTRPQAVSVMDLDAAIKRFVPLDDGTGKYLFDHWSKRIVHKDQMISLLPAGVRWDDVKRHALWIKRGSYYLDQVGFDPAGSDDNCKLNTWDGWQVKPKEGSCYKLLELLSFLCSGEDNHVDLLKWVISWIAYPIQHPGAKMQSAIVVHGPQGTGKSRFFEAVAKIYGEYGIVLNQGAIEDKFNSDWTSRKLFILADEIVARQDMYHLKNQLKAFITGDWVRVNPKNLAAYKERNHMNLVFLSNENQPVALENDDRRHCVIYTPQKLDESFYNEVSEEIDNGGVEALFHLLLNYDLGDFKPWTKPPATKAKMDLININRDSVDSFLIDWREGDLDLPFCPCRSAKLYQAYASWCRRTGERFPRNDRHFMAYIEKLPGWYRGHKNTYENLHYSGATKRSRVVIPSVTDMEKAAKCGLKDYRHNSANQTETQWVTDCVFSFDNAMSKGAEQ